jgi:hypothetical protein
MEDTDDIANRRRARVARVRAGSAGLARPAVNDWRHYVVGAGLAMLMFSTSGSNYLTHLLAVVTITNPCRVPRLVQRGGQIAKDDQAPARP